MADDTADHPPGARAGHGGARAGAGRPRKVIVAPIAVTAPAGPRWYCYATWPQAEGLAGSELARSGYRAYSPQIAARRRDSVVLSLWRVVLIPRFSKYGFVCLDARDPWLPIHRGTAGIRGMLLASNGRPSPIAIGEIEKHMAEDSKLCDLRGDVLPLPLIPRGARVRIEDGAFSGHEARVVADDGMATTLEIEIFGRPVQARVARESVVVVAPDSRSPAK